MSDPLVKNGSQPGARMDHWAPFRDVFGFDPFQAPRSNWAVEYEVTRTESGYEVEVPVPGYKPENVEVTFQDDVVTIVGKGERRTFTRSFSVPEDVDPEKIEAQVKDGMLLLTLARRPEAQPRRIAVK